MSEMEHESDSDCESMGGDDSSCLEDHSDDDVEYVIDYDDCVSDVSVPDVDDQLLDMQMARVTMPTGVQVDITRPITTCSPKSCQSYCRLILLRPANAIAAQERDMVAHEMTATIRAHALGGPSTYDIVEIHKVQNCCLWTRFCEKRKQLSRVVEDVNERMLFHGTPSTDDIVKTGFELKFARKGGMFGPGIYFAQHSSKSNNYSYGLRRSRGNTCGAHNQNHCQLCLRKMLLCRVMLGNSFTLTQSQRMDCPPHGYHSVSGKPGGALRYPEYIVYSEDQIYPEYLITYKT